MYNSEIDRTYHNRLPWYIRGLYGPALMTQNVQIEGVLVQKVYTKM